MMKPLTDDDLSPYRKQAIKLIHVAKRQLGLSEDDYRTVLASATGKESCAEMSLPELNRVMDRLRELGFKPSGGQKAKGRKLSPKTRHKDPATKTQIDKIRALWIACAEVGAVSNRYEQGLNAFVKRMAKVERVDWLRSSYDANKVIEALKAMYERKTGEKPEPEIPPAPLTKGGEADG
jgi:phage gp16-like protein